MIANPELNFHQLYIFAAVARCGSFSRAADQLRISQRAVSIQVHELEKSLGFPLFHRRARGLSLTEVGETVLHYAIRIFALTSEMQGAVLDIQELRMGHLTLGASTTPGEYILPIAIGRFRQIYPNVRVELAISNTAAIVNRILARELDLGMVGNRPTTGANELEMVDYITDEIVMVASPSHPLAVRPSVLLSEVMEAGLVIREEGSATRKAAEHSFAQRGVEPQVAMDLGSNQAIKQTAAAGVGVGVISRHGVTAEVKAGLLQVLDVEGWHCTRPLTLIYTKGKRLLPAQQAFLDLLQRERPVPS